MEPHENWAKQPAVMNLMQLMLTYPEADHSSAVQGLLCGSFRAFRLGHLIGLYRASRLLNKNKELWRNATTNNTGFAFHIWLYHFMGGAKAKLCAADAAFMQRTNSLRTYALREDEAYTSRLRALLKSRGRAVAAGHCTAQADSELAELRSCELPHSILRWSDGAGAAASASSELAPESPPPPGSDVQGQDEDTARLVAFAMGTHPRLGEGYSSHGGPCAVRLLAGNFDMLRQIAARVRQLPPHTLSPPDRETMRLRRLLWQLEQELRAERSASIELRVQLTEAKGEIDRGVRREEGAAAALDEAPAQGTGRQR